MTQIIILLLATAWAAYGVVWWRESRTARPAFGRDTRHDFGRTLGTLAGTTARSRRIAESGVLAGGEMLRAPRTAAEAARRRVEVLVALSVFASVTLLAALAVGGAVWMLHLAADGALFAFAYAVAQRRSLEIERQMKVSMLHPAAPDWMGATGQADLPRAAEA